MESSFLLCFSCELVLKMVAEGLVFFDPSFHDFVWNQFDFFIVGLGIFDKVSAYLDSAAATGTDCHLRSVYGWVSRVWLCDGGRPPNTIYSNS